VSRRRPGRSVALSALFLFTEQVLSHRILVAVSAPTQARDPLVKALDVPVAYLFAEDDDLAAAILAFAKHPSAERQRMREELERLAGTQRG